MTSRRWWCLALCAVMACAVMACDDGPAGPAIDFDRPDLRLVDSFVNSDACIRSDEICNGIDDDCDGLIDDDDPDLQRLLFSDPDNCGHCDNPCGAPPNTALTECLVGRCLINTCTPGFNDQNGRYDDGCESDCRVTNGGAELCDRSDNDCDGTIDEGFDLRGDLNNCGACAARCEAVPDAQITCDDGQCAIAACAGGFIDLDGNLENGCEYRCTANGDREFCNGLDDDCDGVIDEAADLTAPADFCGQGGACAAECDGDGDCGAGERCNAGACVLANGGPTGQICATDADCVAVHPGYGCVGASEPKPDNTGPQIVRRCVPRQHAPVCDGDAGFRCLRGPLHQPRNELGRCDTIDNDCDGRIDEDYVDQLYEDGANRSIARTCEAGLGLCRRSEVFRCADDGDGTVCPVRAGDPVRTLDDDCNGRDDDCNGRVDEDFVDTWVNLGGFSIYAFEATRPGATADSPGLDLNPDDGVDAFVESRACSRSGVQPWANVTWASARDACAAAGARLCTAAEWARACDGGVGRAFPYGNDYDPDACNGGEHDVDPLTPDIQDAATPTGALAACVSGGVFDLSGNLKEWTSTADGALRAVRGGGFETNVPAGLTCAQAGDFKPAEFRSEAIGFRCCRD